MSHLQKSVCFAVLSMFILNGCDSKTDNSSIGSNSPEPSVTAETSEPQPISQDNPTPSDSISPTTIPSTATDDVQAVTPNGFGGLTFGQEITDDLLNTLGLVKDDVILNESCYYVHDPKLTYMDDNFGERASVLYQIIDGVVALISIQDPSIPFYTGVQVGDTPARVMSVHDDNVSYAMDKYATDGDYYQLMHNVNFEVTQPPAMGDVLTKEHYQLNDNAKKYNQTTPLQIKYKFREGQSLGQTDIASDAWTDDDKGKLAGTLYTIDIGEPEAIYLVEGCG